MLHIRTDGNAKIGTGHMMRCMEIAKAYEETVGSVQFLVADDDSKNFIESKGFLCYKMDSVWNDMETELDRLSKCKEECKVERLLIDSYFVTKEYVNAWKSLGVKVAYLDDLAKDDFAPTALFNGAIWATKEKYAGVCTNATKLYLGCKYLPLRKEFSTIEPKKVNQKADKILVLSGGTDPYHFLLRFIDNIPKDMDGECQYYLVCGIFNEDYEKILAACKERDNIHVLRNAGNLYEYMLMADVAVSAGGMTLYELCACGTPAITYLLADNQQGNIDGFIKEDIFETIGDIRDEIDFNLLFEQVRSLLNDYEKRMQKAERIQKLVDGKGAYRIAGKLKDM